MRRRENPQGYYSLPTRASFPVSGREGFRYRAEDTKAMYIYLNGVYEDYSGTGSGGVGTGKSAYELAVEEGFAGTLVEWLESLQGEDGQDALVFGSELIPLIPGTPGEKGEDGKDGRDVDPYGSEIIGLLPGPEGKEGKSGEDGESALVFGSEIISTPSWSGGTGTGGTGTGSGAGEHGDLPGLLPVGINPGDANHVTGSQMDAINDLVARRPQKPMNLSPESGEADVLETPTFVSTPYYHSYNVPMYGIHFRLYDDADNIIYDSGIVPTTVAEFAIPDSILQSGEVAYQWDIAHIGSNLVYSPFSDKTAFTTAQVWVAQYIDRPKMLIPAQGQVYNGDKPFLFLSAPSLHGGIAEGDRNFKITSDAQGTVPIDTGTSNSDLYQSAAALPRGQMFYAFGQHTSDSPVPGIESQWSMAAPFMCREHYRGSRIGIVLLDEENYLFERIGGDFLPVYIDGNYWLTNSIWGVWEASLNKIGGEPAYTDINGQKMIIIPSFWILSGRVPSGPYAGKRMWMIDPAEPTPEEKLLGWHRHAMFAHPNGGYQDMLPVSAYCLSVDASSASSVNTTPSSWTETQWLTWINNLNTDINDPLRRGWTLMPYYTVEGLALLGMIEYANTQRFYEQIIMLNQSSIAYGYRGIKIWNKLSPAVALKMYGLHNGSAMLPGLALRVPLMPQILPANPPPSGGSALDTYPAKTSGFLSSEDGISSALQIDDYMIPKPISPEEYGELNTIPSPYVSIIVRSSRGVTNQNLEISFGTRDKRGMLSVGSDDLAANPVQTHVAMMVKYD